MSLLFCLFSVSLTNDEDFVHKEFIWFFWCDVVFREGRLGKIGNLFKKFEIYISNFYYKLSVAFNIIIESQ